MKISSLCGLKKLLVLAGTILMMEAIYANPEGGVVTSGSATIHQAPGNTTINQTSQQAVINWQSFNIKPHETTHFAQPSSSAIALNRINPDQGASQIFGRLTADGRIILVNQAGFYFGSGAYVNVGGIIVSTVNISDQNFLAGQYSFTQPSSFHGVIINEGYMHAAKHGLVALVGANVTNNGSIQAKLGTVVLASGDSFTMDLNGDGLISFKVNKASSGNGFDEAGNQVRDGVTNNGTIIANGGKILITARAAQGVVDNAINMSGVVQARSVSQKGGEIIFSANGPVTISGHINVSSKHGQGGHVKIMANRVNVKSTATIDVSGSTAGGSVLIASKNSDSRIKFAGHINATGYNGGTVKLLASTIRVGTLAKMDVSGMNSGGRVIITSKTPNHSSVKFAGQISATGYNGGTVKLLASTIRVGTLAKIDVSGMNSGGRVIIASKTPNHSSVKFAGQVSATGYNGGTVKLLASTIHVGKLAKIDVSGMHAGGEVLIGGNAHGAGPEMNAKKTTVDKGAVILANAITMGNGGKVIVWSDNATAFHGSISAQGGLHGGNGGFVETSGHYLNVADAKINLTAPQGKTGTWLLDPENVIIQSNNNTNFNGNFSGGNPDSFTPTGANSIVDVALLEAALATANVTITTGTTGSQQGNIIIAAPITWSTGNTLRFNAANNVIIYQNGSTPMISAPRGNLILNATNLVQLFGSLAVGGAITANANRIESYQKPQITSVLEVANAKYIGNTDQVVRAIDTQAMNLPTAYITSRAVVENKKQVDQVVKQQKNADAVQMGSTRISCNRSGKGVCDSLDVSVAMNSI